MTNEHFELDPELAPTLPGAPPSVRRPTRKEVDFYYKTHRSQFFSPERFYLLHIVKNRDELSDCASCLQSLREAERELASGFDFADVADRYSDCVGNGGHLGWIEKGIMVEEFEQVVFALERGQTSPVFETRFGWHLVRLLDRKPAAVAPLREVYEEIAETIYRRRLARAGNPFPPESKP